MSYRVEISERAKASICEHARFIATERQAPENSQRWLTKVWDAIESLEVLPHGFPIAPENEFRHYEIRMRIIGNYVLLFTVDEPAKTAYEIGFRHGAQLPRPEELPDDPTDRS